ncbi:hypothetical protein C8R42DRAFT_640577 [Lentinula raphanica]|nr:hypothetical protein C8R42DRAFT_640577 [Lentinula raphanica]
MFYTRVIHLIFVLILFDAANTAPMNSRQPGPLNKNAHIPHQIDDLRFSGNFSDMTDEQLKGGVRIKQRQAVERPGYYQTTVFFYPYSEDEHNYPTEEAGVPQTTESKVKEKIQEISRDDCVDWSRKATRPPVFEYNGKWAPPSPDGYVSFDYGVYWMEGQNEHLLAMVDNVPMPKDI